MGRLRIIDARSGKNVSVGEWVFYPPPSPVTRQYIGQSGVSPEGCPDLTPDWKDPSSWQIVENLVKPVIVPGQGTVSKDSFRLLDLHDRGDHADVHVETITGHRSWMKAPIKGVLFWRTAILPT